MNTWESFLGHGPFGLLVYVGGAGENTQLIIGRASDDVFRLAVRKRKDSTSMFYTDDIAINLQTKDETEAKAKALLFL